MSASPVFAGFAGPVAKPVQAETDVAPTLAGLFRSQRKGEQQPRDTCVRSYTHSQLML